MKIFFTIIILTAQKNKQIINLKRKNNYKYNSMTFKNF